MDDIGRRNFAPIYLLMGEEGYFIDSICDELTGSILTEAERSFNQIVLYGRDSEAGVVVNYCRQAPMMGSHEVVAVKEAQHLRSIEKLTHYTTTIVSSTILIICYKDKNLDKRSQLYKSIVKSGGVILESVRPRDYEIGGWLTEFIASKGRRITPKALAMVVDNLGTDISKISNEISKLIISTPNETLQIEDSHIEKHIGISKEYNNYELARAVLSRDVKKALSIADNFAHNPKNNPLLVTIMVLFAEFKKIFIINYLRWLTRQKGGSFPSDIELMKSLKVSNQYVIGELKTLSAKWNNANVFRILGLMREYDGKSKGINSGGASDGELLRELLLKIFA